MRHGQSLANTAGIIVSHPKNGLNDYGLSDLGREQVKNTISQSSLNSDARIFSSDFKRARETAEIVHDNLQCQQPVLFEKRLRERFFGDLELGPDNRYAEIWSNDTSQSEQETHGAESIFSVVQRAFEVILYCEETMDAETCLLIAHGDILQILQTVFYGLPATHHRELPHLETAEVRLLKIKS